MESKLPALGLLLAATVLASLAVIFFSEQWLEWMVALQSGPVPNPATDVRQEYVTGVVSAVLLTLVVALWGLAVHFQGPLVKVWLAKTFMVLVLMLFYDFRYGYDVDGFFGHATMPDFTWQPFELGNGTVNTRLITWLSIQAFSDSFHATRLLFALVGLVAGYLVFRAGVLLIGREDRRPFYTFALMPSVLFWSSVLGKDPITLLGVAAYTYGVVAWFKLGRARYLLWVIAGVTVALYVRVWLGPILLIPLTVLGLMHARGLAKRVSFAVIGVIGIVSAPLAIERAIGVDMSRPDDLLGTTNALARSFEVAGSTQDVPELATVGDLASFAPLGMFTILFRPFPGEVLNVFGVLASIENVFLLFLTMRAAWRTRLKDVREPLVAWALAVVLLWAAVYSVNSFQNLGTANRHRLEIMPLFLGLLLYLGRRRQSVTTVPGSWSGRPLMGTRRVA